MSSSSRRGGTGQSRQLEVIKNLVAAGDYHYSRKVREFIAEGWYDKEDLERCILYATTIHKVEADEMGSPTDGCKYTILGRDTHGQCFYTCGKIILSPEINGNIFSLPRMRRRNDSISTKENEAMQSTLAFGYVCQECGEGTVREQVLSEYPTKMRGYPFVVKEARIGVCDRCGAEHFAARETQRWEEQFEAEHATHYMQPKEIRALQRTLGMTMEQFAFLLGCTRQSLYNWQRQDRRKPQSRMADVLMKLVRESHAKGTVDVLQFLMGEARQFGVEIELGASNGAPRTPPIILRTIRMSPVAGNTKTGEPMRLAADTTEEESIVALVSAAEDPVGTLSYDFGTASLDLEFKTTPGFDQCDATIRFKDGEVAEVKAVKVKGQRVRLLAETNRTEDDVCEVVLTPREKSLT